MKNTEFGRQGSRFVNRMGERYTRLTVVGFAGKDKRSQCLWLCRCDCGKEKVVNGKHLGHAVGGVKSCGCLAHEHSLRLNRIHGNSKHPRFSVWLSMISRCHNVKDVAYSRYGGRGIFVCEEWRQDFDTFVSDMGPKPEGTSIDRIDNNLGYFKDNCRWATPSQQSSNRRSNLLFSWNGKTQILSSWCKELGIDYDLVNGRVRKGWSFEKSISEPVKRRRT